MTERKPPSLSFPDWVELQVRDAERSGAFDNLPGKGKPIPGLGEPQHELAWIADKLRRENIDIAGVLPPGLALAKEVEVLRETLRSERVEARVRDRLNDLNDRIQRAWLQPQDGPPVRVRPVDVDAVLAQWRADRAEIDAAAPRPRPAEPAPARRRRRRHPLWRRLGRWTASEDRA